MKQTRQEVSSAGDAMELESVLEEMENGWMFQPSNSYYNYSNIIADPESYDREQEKFEEYDDMYHNEIGYSFIQSLRGDSLGRQIKRYVFILGLIQLVCGFILMCVSIHAHGSWLGEYLLSTKYGISISILLWLISIPSLILGFFVLAMIYFYASFCTNRYLIKSIMQLYLCLLFPCVMFLTWYIIVLLITFEDVRWNNGSGLSAELSNIYPDFISSLVFALPYDGALFFLAFDISWLIEQIDDGAIFIEPNMNGKVYDMSEMTLSGLLLLIIVIPLSWLLQLSDLANALYAMYLRQQADEATAVHENENMQAHTTVANKPKGNGVLRRLTKTITRICCQPINSLNQLFFSHRSTASYADQLKLSNLSEEELANVDNDGNNRGNSKYLEKYKSVDSNYSNNRDDQELVTLAPTMPVEKEAEADDVTTQQSTVLSLKDFKTVWANYPTGGAFQTKLQDMPNKDNLKKHLEEQGFHIVFAQQNGDTSDCDIEIGLCNMQSVGSDVTNAEQHQTYWFMARFLISRNTFSAVMKSTDDGSIIKRYVKMFMFAKVLRMDISK